VSPPRPRPLALRALSLATAAAFVTTSCGPTARPVPDKGPGGGDAALEQPAEAPPGFVMLLSDGRQGPAAADRSALAPAARLDDAAATRLLDRVSPLQAQAGDVSPFSLRDRSKPPPRTGKVIKDKFPAPPTAAAIPTTNDAGKELKVLRWAPEGDVPLAPQLQLTFSQPMVPVTSQDDAAAVVPVTLTPQPPGRWRWVGTRTVLFDPAVRFPQATTYTVEVPAGTRSATGNVLKEATRFSFTTPPPTLENSYPSYGPMGLDVPLFAQFDQRIDPAAVLGRITVTADGQRVAVRALAAEELDQFPDLAPYLAAARAGGKDGRWLAFKPVAPLPKNAQVTVTVGAGTPSAEGPNATTDDQGWEFFTYPPLQLEDGGCNWDRHACPPGSPINLQFNNPLDEDRWDDALITVEPAVPGLRIQQSGGYVSLVGQTAGRTRYTVTVSGGVIDTFGQALGKDASVTFRTTDANPQFYGPSGMLVVDPASKPPTYDVFTTNYEALRVKLYEVQPSDFAAFAHYLQNQWNTDRPPTLPGIKRFDEQLKTGGARDVLTETRIDLRPALGKAGRGHVIAEVEPYPWKEAWVPPRLVTWLQVSQLAVDAWIDGEELSAWVTRLADGAPVEGAAITVAPFKLAATTDARGNARVKLRDSSPTGPGMLIARAGDDTAFVLDDYAWWGESSSWLRAPGADTLRWYVADDRRMYRPGETVHLKGWLRRVGEYEGGDVAGLAGAISQVTLRVADAQGNELHTGTAKVNAAGAWDAAFTLPKTPNLGTAQVTLSASGRGLAGNAYHSFEIQEFRRPEYEVTAAASQGPHVIGGAADVTATASYYAGGGLAGAPVNWFLTATQTTYTPPGRDDFTFGQWTPWWGWRAWWAPGPAQPAQSWSHAATTDALGQHVLHLDFRSVNPTMPMSVTASTTVTDVNRQGWSAAAALLVHPSTAYVGLRTARPFVEADQPIVLDGVVVDLDGRPRIGAPYAVEAVRLAWEYEKGQYVTKKEDRQTCDGAAGAAPFRCEFTPSEGGTYEITATTTDAEGRRNQTVLTVWVAGGDVPPARGVEREQVNLIPDGKEYQAGDVAKLLVQAPFFPAEGLMTIRRSGVVRTERFTMAGPTHTLSVPIEEGHVPNVHVQVDLVGKASRVDDDGRPRTDLPSRPAYGGGSISLPVPPRRRTLAVTVTPAAEQVGPGEPASFAVAVADAAGKPVAGAEVALIVVDEAILGLTGYRHASPIDTFYTDRAPGARDVYYRGMITLARPDADALAMDGVALGSVGTIGHGSGGGAGSGYGRGAGPASSAGIAPSAGMAADESYAEETMSKSMAPAPPPPPPAPGKRAVMQDKDAAGGETGAGALAVAVRTNFDPLAAFSPSVATDARGRAAVEVKMPDNLTRYRVVAIVSAGERDFGKGESAITARLPLMVRPSPPRFLNFGDTFELPVVVQNQTSAPLSVDVAVRATNARLTDGAGRTVTVPAGDRVEVRFPAAAASAGTARFQLVASSGAFSDAAELALPVWTPATTEAFATYGVIDDGAIRQPVTLPGKVVTSYGGLEVETSSTQLQALTDALLYLVTYPFECSEQRASRILSITSLRDVLTAFSAEGLPSPAELEARVTADLERLQSMQNWDGGFPWWQRGYDSWPFLSVHVSNALVRARQKGYAVDAQMLARAQSYLQRIEQYYPWYYSPEVRRTITSYALYVRKLMGDLDSVRARGLVKEAGGVDGLSMEAVGWLVGVLAGDAASETERKALQRHLDNRAVETAAAANWSTAYADGAHLLLHSDRRVDAIVLESLIQEAPDSDLLPKVVTGLLGHKKAGRWLNTQENVFVLMALDRYFETFEKVTPDFVARVWLGSQYAGEHAFKGRSTDRHAVDIPMQYVADAGKADLVVQKDGAGRLYYRIGMTYAPADLKLPPADHGFTVTRRYEAVDDPADVARNPDGSWRVKAGARVRVRVNLVAESRRYHVALVDPLPAGLEPMNPALAVTGPIPQDPQEQAERGRYWWWSSTWYEHQNLRDERAEAFTTQLWEGVWEYTYVARATTPGNFVVPPAKAEEMYFPETFGRSASDRVIVQ
jgi:hypothetical protein